MNAIWGFLIFGAGTCFGAVIMSALIVSSDIDDRETLFRRLQEMEYALEGGNTAREDIPADELRKWLLYVWTGKDVQP